MNGQDVSPIYQIRDTALTGNRIFVMREDLLPFSAGGNKVRIAAEFFRDMREKDCDVMVAYGNVRSNLCRVIANRCYAEGIRCYLICSREDGEDLAETSNSRLMKLLGAHVVPCEKGNIAETVETLLEHIRAEGHRPYYIYGNKYGEGNEGVAAGAYRKAYGQIREYSDREQVDFDYIFHASGTGATQAGLVCGHILAGDAARIVGILISSREYARAVSVIQNGLREALRLAGRPWQERYGEEILLEGSFTKGGYGVYDEEILDCVRREFRENGILLDPVYTGKAFWGMQQYLRRERITGNHILFIHTGGTPLFYDCLCEGEIV